MEENSCIQRFIQKINNIQLPYWKSLLLYFLSVILISLPLFFAYYLGYKRELPFYETGFPFYEKGLGIIKPFLGINTRTSLIQMNALPSPDIGFFIIIIVVITVIKIIEILYLFAVNSFFLKSLRFYKLFTSFAFVSLLPGGFIILSFLYNASFLFIIGTTSVFAKLFFPLTGIITQYVLTAQYLQYTGFTRKRSYAALFLPWVLILLLASCMVISLFPFVYDYIVKAFVWGWWVYG